MAKRLFVLAFSCILPWSAWAGPIGPTRLESALAPLGVAPDLGAAAQGALAAPAVPFDQISSVFDVAAEMSLAAPAAAEADSASAPEPKGPTLGEILFDHAKPVVAGEPEVVVDTVREIDDIRALIPPAAHVEGAALVAGLEENFEKMAPFLVHTHMPDRYVAIDLKSKPEILDYIPHLRPHERDFIRRIMARNPDVQVLLRQSAAGYRADRSPAPGEALATPDLIVGGRVVEMKSFMKHGQDYRSDRGIKLFERANHQVRAHAQRHGLGPGAFAADLRLHGLVPADMEARIERWRASVGKFLAVDRIFVFTRDDFAVFLLGADGRFHRGPPVLALFQADARSPAIC